MDFTDSESQSEQNDVPVPNVVGKLEKDASSTLSAAGFKVSKTYKYDDSVDAGKLFLRAREAEMHRREVRLRL